MRSGKRKTDKKSPGRGSFRREPVLDSAVSSATVHHSMQGQQDASQQVRFFTPQGEPLQKDVVPPLSILPDSAPKPFQSQDESAFPGNGDHARRDTAVPSMQAHQQNPAFISGMPPYMAPPAYPAAGGFPPNAGYGIPPAGVSGGKSNSSLHAALIVMIVFVGLAIGLANFVWVNDKREAKLAQERLAKSMVLPPTVQDAPVVSDIPATPDIPAAPGIPAAPDLSAAEHTDSAAQSYMPSQTTENQRTPNQTAPNLPLEKELVSEKNEVRLDGYLTPSLSLPKALERMEKEEGERKGQEEKSISAAPPPQPETAKTEKPNNAVPGKAAAQPEKKRKPRSENQPKKMADATKKDKNRIKEIDRVRIQAYSESSKDRIEERKPSPNTPIGPQSEKRKSYRSSALAQRTVSSSEYARCERAGNIIDRERCKWQLCNNKWGKGGCPSFRHERPYIF